MGCLYKLTSPSGKSYIGITLRDFDTRWNGHIKDARRGSPNPIHRAIRQYGPKSFKKEILLSSNIESELLAAEAEAVIVHNTLKPFGYNLAAGGKGVLIRCQATIDRQSRSAKNRFSKRSERSAQSHRIAKSWNDPGARERFTNLRRVYCRTESFRELARKRIARQRLNPDFLKSQSDGCVRTMKALWSHPVYRARQLATLQSKTSREKAGKALKLKYSITPKRGTRNGQKNSRAQNAKIGAANAIALKRPEVRAVISRNTARAWADPEHRRKRIEAMRAALAKRKSLFQK